MAESYLPIIFAGPSGSGKSTIISLLMKSFPDKFGFSISHTTRTPRPSEVDNVHYHFVSKEEMERLISEGEFVEHAIYNGNYYGTSKTAINNLVEKKKIGLLDIDLQGVRKVQATNFPANYIFVSPPSLEILRARLIGRADTSPEAIENRISIATRELNERKDLNWNAEFVNDNLDECYAAINKWISENYA